MRSRFPVENTVGAIAALILSLGTNGQRHRLRHGLEPMRAHFQRNLTIPRSVDDAGVAGGQLADGCPEGGSVFGFGLAML